MTLYIVTYADGSNIPVRAPSLSAAITRARQRRIELGMPDLPAQEIRISWGEEYKPKPQ